MRALYPRRIAGRLLSDLARQRSTTIAQVAEGCRRRYIDVEFAGGIFYRNQDLLHRALHVLVVHYADTGVIGIAGSAGGDERQLWQRACDPWYPQDQAEFLRELIHVPITFGEGQRARFRRGEFDIPSAMQVPF